MAVNIRNVYANRLFIKANATGRSSTTTVAADPELVVPLEAHKKFEVIVYLALSGNIGGNFKCNYAVTNCSFLTNRFCTGKSISDSGSSTINTRANIVEVAYNTEQSYGLSADSNITTVVERFIVQTTDNATLTLQWAQSISFGTNTVLRDKSYIKVTEVH